MADAGELKALLVELAGELGFARVGVAPAGPSAQAERFRSFLAKGYHGQMTYLARDAAGRCDPRRLLEGAASVICLAASYAPPAGRPSPDHVARYARGRDYHRLLRSRCRRLVAALSQAAPKLRARICVDTGPLLERDLAAQAGLGWIGRNGCLIDRRWGSYLLLAEVVTDLPLEPDAAAKARCGACHACIDACPTAAIGAAALVDCRRCISYLTIEHRGEIPPEFRPAMGRWVFGCDVCQEVCPFNRRPPPGQAELIGPSALAQTSAGEILEWTQGRWDAATRGSAARRARYEMLLRNAAIAAGNAADPSAAGSLKRLASGGPALAAEAAGWALARLAGRA